MGSFTFGPGLFDGGRASAQSLQADGSVQGARPNILVIKVDQLRFPSVFPPGINSVDDFLKQFMPNLYQLWRNGVKFASHYTAACACTPARGTIITGLYSQQSWLVQTITASPGQQVSAQPWLNPAYPTYGKLLRRVGYQTPYVGKWHVSIPRQNTPRLEEYGFDGLTWPDPTGSNLQGTYGDDTNYYTDPINGNPIYAPFRNDEDIATQGAQWLQQNAAGGAAPWCLTVSFVNPHDKEFFWAGTEFQTYNGLFDAQSNYQPFTPYSTPENPPYVPWDTDQLKSPPSLYLDKPPNWESADQIKANKPSTQTFSRLFQEAVWGGVADDPAQQGFTIDPYPPAPYAPICKNGKPLGIGKAPFGYWRRSLELLCPDHERRGRPHRHGAEGIRRPARLRPAEHCYRFHVGPRRICERARLPLREARELLRGGLPRAAHHRGSVGAFHGRHRHAPPGPHLLRRRAPAAHKPRPRGQPRLAEGEHRPDLRRAARPAAHAALVAGGGPDYVLLATDEGAPSYFNFNSSPVHLAGVRTQGLKFGLYANWQGATDQIADDETLETELYDYSTAEGQAELDNLKHDPRIPALKQTLLGNLIPNVLRAPLPGLLGAAQTASRDAYLAYDALLRKFPAPSCNSSGSTEDLAALLPFGQDF